MSSIRLHPKLGVNPRLCYCPRCGGETNTLVLVGVTNYVTTCSSCGCRGYGIASGKPCPMEGCQGQFDDRRELEEHEKLPGDLCETCQQEIAQHKAIVEAGGVFFRCEKCGITGVFIGTSETAKRVRAHAKIEAPAPMGVALHDCSYHTVAPEPAASNPQEQTP